MIPRWFVIADRYFPWVKTHLWIMADDFDSYTLTPPVLPSGGHPWE